VPASPDPARKDAPKIVIVGGVAGGASAAARARRLNERAEIVMFEKDEFVSFANCGLPYFIGGEITDRSKLLIATPALFHRRFRVDTRVRSEVVAINRDRRTVTVHDHATGKEYEETYDKLILSPGAVPIVPDIPGADAEGVFTLRNIPDMDRILAALDGARSAVVVGAGYIGLEMAEQLAHKKLDVAIVELQSQVMPFFDFEAAEPLHREIERNGVRLELGRALASIDRTDGAVTGVTLTDGTRIGADMVIMSIGVRPLTGLAEAAGLRIGASGGISADNFMRTSDPDIYAVGDAAEYLFGPTGMRQRVPLAGIANRAGRVAGQHAATGSSRPCPAAWATSIVRAFGVAAGLAGLSQRQAIAAGYDAGAVHIVSYHHSSYYPGAEPLGVKLVYDRATRQVLGAQAVGRAGVDKRLDVVTTLIHFPRHGRRSGIARSRLCAAVRLGQGSAAHGGLRGTERSRRPRTADGPRKRPHPVPGDRRAVRRRGRGDAVPARAACQAHRPRRPARQAGRTRPGPSDRRGLPHRPALLRGDAHPAAARVPRGLQPVGFGRDARLRHEPRFRGGVRDARATAPAAAHGRLTRR
jgi:NADPH-dependent 2,4-dienoyl-CoA reductase/sulfur reductase-like enzyme